ncbi:saccharopine dehydrogenase family protein [Pueribacillus sp. YX66]|uniref:saccharopine dehydrogenase family protein n=1 Tax=Pueribacillus sp. YX66 TaxID=3229242 RepID=UPI00358D7799
MKKIVVLGGAGGMGSVAVKDLTLNGKFDGIVIADANEQAAKQVANEIGSEKVSIAKIDVSDETALVDLLREATVVLNFIGPFYKFGPLVIRAALATKTHYVDICDDYDAAEAILAMDDKAKKAGITVLTGMGTSPGITNVFARMGIDELDVAEEIDTIWVMGEAETGTAVLYHVFHGGSGYIPGFDQGKRTMIQPFGKEGSLTVEFPNPLGRVTVYDIGHPEPITIPHFFPEIRKVTNKGTLLPPKVIETFKSLIQLGFGSEEPIQIDHKIKISPRDFVVKFLQARPDLLDVDHPFGFGGLKVIVKGKKDGENVSYVYTTASNESTGESTGIPAAVGAELIATEKINKRGVIAPEVLDPKVVLKALGNRKRLNQHVKSTGIIIEKVFADGTIETIKAGRTIYN